MAYLKGIFIETMNVKVLVEFKHIFSYIYHKINFLCRNTAREDATDTHITGKQFILNDKRNNT